MSPEELQSRLDAVERLTRLFTLERRVHLAVTCVSLVVLLFSFGLLLTRHAVGPAEYTLMFGSSGVISYSASRLLYMWTQALRVLVPEEESSQ